VRWFLLVGWRFVLGLRLGPRTSLVHVLGWTIIKSDTNSITLELQSWLLTAQLVFRTDESHVTQATFVRYNQPIAAFVWPAVSLIHCQIVPRLLRRAGTLR